MKYNEYFFKVSIFFLIFLGAFHAYSGVLSIYLFYNEYLNDQSIFSLIRKQFNPCLIQDETYFEEFNNDISLKYPFWATRHADNRLSFLKYYLNLN